jgi:hypothetical protein
MWNNRKILPVMAILFLIADSSSFALSFAAPFASFTLIRLPSKQQAMQSAYSLRASTSVWSLKMFTGPQSLTCYYFCPAILPQKNEDWPTVDHRALCERLPFVLLSFLRRIKAGLQSITVFCVSVSLLSCCPSSKEWRLGYSRPPCSVWVSPFCPAVLPQKNKNWTTVDHRALYERLPFFSF